MAMSSFLIFVAFILTGLSFAAWLGAFILNLIFDTERVTEDERARSLLGQATYGALILILFATLWIYVRAQGIGPYGLQ